MSDYARVKSRVAEAKHYIRHRNRSNWISHKVKMKKQTVMITLFSLYVLAAIALYLWDNF
ncbi:MAG: hypothetical protein OXH73_10990 [Caldilineaceae bacterium]|nr:hypothetical protein [Caldilineaceae bacterium]